MTVVNFEEPIRIESLCVDDRVVEILFEYDLDGEEWWSLIENGMNIPEHEYDARTHSFEDVKTIVTEFYKSKDLGRNP